MLPFAREWNAFNQPKCKYVISPMHPPEVLTNFDGQVM